MKQIDTLWFPKLISDGMVLSSHGEKRIYGKSKGNDNLTLTIQGAHYNIIANSEGDFEIVLEALQIGGPYELLFKSDAFGDYVIKDVYAGETFVASGQSNMQLPMRRVEIAFSEEWKQKEKPLIRMFKVSERVEFHGAKDDFIEGEWVTISPETIDELSAAAYFFASSLHEKTKVPIGVIQGAIGGTPIQSWMPKELLLDKDAQLLASHEEEEFVNYQLQKNEKQEKDWYERLDSQDLKLQKLKWIDKQTVSIPCLFNEFLEDGFCGSIWLKKEFEVKENSIKDKDSWVLHLGTLVDADDTYINGVKVGHTDYQYPPRLYQVPSELIQDGVNEIVVRVIVNQGKGRWTPGKAIYIKSDHHYIDLSGEWLCQVGGKMSLIPPADFLTNKPTGLHNGMLAPCFNYGISGFLWYQGESNTKEADSYEFYLAQFIHYIRRRFKSDNLPVAIVQLANFDIDLEPCCSGWPEVREAQRRVAKALDCGLIVTLDAGESNDLHPLDKKTIGQRLAIYMLDRVFGNDVLSGGPELERIKWLNDGRGCHCVFSNYSQGIRTKKVHALHTIKQRAFIEKVHAVNESEVDGFVIKTRDQRLYQVKGQIECSSEDDIDNANTVLLTMPNGINMNQVAEIQYAYENNPTGNLLCNKEGFMASPFIFRVLEKN